MASCQRTTVCSGTESSKVLLPVKDGGCMQKPQWDSRTNSSSEATEEMMQQFKRDIIKLDTHQDSEVGRFYANRSVFITGASGFVGKCLVEKLLRSCPDIKRLYILLRPKKGLKVGERLEILLKSRLFERLRELEWGSEQLEKIEAIEGDITQPMLGVSPDDLKLLIREVSIMFHSAATVKFVEPLRTAIENNVLSVSNMVDFASKLAHLEALLHISTAYSNCDRRAIEEKIYEPPIKPERLIEMSEWMDKETLENIAPALYGGMPNSYTYTKSVAEGVLYEKARKLLPNIPIGVVRPSIVAGTWRQPVCGWVDNFNGPAGAILAMMTGAIQAMQVNPRYCADIIPVDIVTNLVICAAWQVHSKHQQTKSGVGARGELVSASDAADPAGGATVVAQPSPKSEICVFNCVSGSLNPVTWGDFAKHVVAAGLEFPCNDLIRIPGSRLIPNDILFRVYNFIFHYAFSHLGDLAMRLLGQKPTLVAIYSRLLLLIVTLKPFATNQWDFECSNVTSLYGRMNPIDQEIFNFDVRQIDWQDFLRKYFLGSKTFLLKDDPKKLMGARRKLKLLQNARFVLQMIMMALAYYFLLSGSSIEAGAITLVGSTVASLTWS